MSNSYFQFKKFRVDQGDCAMKVTTDACVLGAWTPVPLHAARALDIGTGTGLLALMLAQRSPSLCIDAIELDPAATTQARMNAAQSPWAKNINIVAGDVRNFTPDIKYDLIITNPPFFNNSLLSDTGNKNMARHTLSLSYQDLVSAADRLLSPSGELSILLPINEYAIWEALMRKNNWQCIRKLSVYHRPGAAVKRIVALFGKQVNKNTVDQKIFIYNSDNAYSEAFTKLLYPFYLDL